MRYPTSWLNGDPTPGYLYRAYNADGVLLYVGCTTNLCFRLKEHARNAIWRTAVARWRVRMHLTWEAALAAEREAIETEHPRWNIVYRSRQHPDGYLHLWTDVALLYPDDVTLPRSPLLNNWRGVELNRARRAASTKAVPA